MKRLAAELALHTVTFTGAMPEPYREAHERDIFFFGTHPREGFGIAMWEALGAGMTLVASETPASRAAAHLSDVHYYDYGDTQGLANVLQRVAQSRNMPRSISGIATGEEMLNAYLEVD
jgi:hypothetical protein